MSNSVQEFLAANTQKTAVDLETAFLRLPEDKRLWSAMDKARSAADLVAECAILNGHTSEVIKNRRFSDDFDMETYSREKAALAQDWTAMQALLKANTAKATEAIRAVPDSDLDNEIQMPWGPMTLSAIISYPYWNMSYHEGQINFIASMLGCLD